MNADVIWSEILDRLVDDVSYSWAEMVFGRMRDYAHELEVKLATERVTTQKLQRDLGTATDNIAQVLQERDEALDALDGLKPRTVKWLDDDRNAAIDSLREERKITEDLRAKLFDRDEELRNLEGELDATRRELERWKTSTQVEGDYVTMLDQIDLLAGLLKAETERSTELEAENGQLREQIQRLENDYLFVH